MREPSATCPVWPQPSCRLRTAACLAGLWLGLLAPGAQANVILVAASAVGTSSSQCSLVDAIIAANSNAASGGCPAGDDQTNGGDVIVLSAGTYKIGSVDNDWYGPNGLPPITSKITIVGDPKGTVIMRSAGQGVQAFRIFFVGGGQSAASFNPPTDFSVLPGPGNLTLINLTIENGLAQGGAGGASSQGSAGGGLGAGGAIYNQGTLTLQGVTLVGNQAIGGAGGGSSSTSNGDPGGGGGMAGSGDSFGNGGGFNPNGSWPDSTTPSGDFGNGGSANQAGGVGGGGGSGARGGYGGGGGGGGIGAAGGFGGGGGGLSGGGFGGGAFQGGGGGMGGAIFNEGGTLTLLNCTVTDNTAAGGIGGISGIGNGLALGGAIFNLNGTVSIRFSTLANNILAGASGTSGDGGSIYSLQLASPGSPAANAGSSASLNVSSSILYGSVLNTTDSSGNVTSAAATDCLSNGGTFGGNPSVIGASSTSCLVGGDLESEPFLLPLANNGGPTQSMGLIIGPALGSGTAAGAPLLDQRGYLRNAGAPDMGAYELSNTQKLPPSFSGLQSITLIAGGNASLEWFNLSGNDASKPALTIGTLSSNSTVLPASNLALSANCGASTSLDTCSLSLTPTAKGTGSANVILSATNGYGETGYGIFAVTVIPPAPVADSASASVASGQTLNGTLTATDALTVTLTFGAVTQPTNGTLKLSSTGGGAYTYTPNSGFIGSDSFTWQANDGSSNSNVATVSITVTAPPPPPGAPTVSNQAFTVTENTPLDGTLQAQGVSLSFAIATQPGHGTVSISDAGTGAFTYTPDNGYTGADSFTYTAENTLLKATSNPATVSLTVNSSSGSGAGSGSGSGSGGPNSVAPVASSQTLSTYAGIALSGTLAASDAGGNPLKFTVTQPAHGTVALGNAATGAFTYTPAAGYTGADSFTYTADDTVTGLSSTAATVSLTVMAVPVSSSAAPLASNASFTTYLDVAVNGNLSGSDAAGNALTYTLATPPAHGTVNVTAASGAFVYTPSTGYTGSDSFTYTAADSVSGVSSAAATVVFTVDALPPPSPAPPAASALTLTTYENAVLNGSVTASDSAGNALVYASVGAPAHGTLTAFNTATGAFQYTPTAGYIGSDSFSFTAKDNTTGLTSASATVSIAVSALPPPAPVAGNLSVSTYVGVPVTAVLPASDGAGNAITYAVVAATTHANPNPPTISATGSFVYTPAAGFAGGSDSMSYTVTDSVTHVVSAPATVNFSVIALPTSGNATPLANNAAVTLYENHALSSTLSGVVSPTSDGVSYAIVAPPSHGSLPAPGAGGTFTYTPTANYTGPDAFTFTIKDTTTGLTSAPASVVVTVASSPPPSTPPQGNAASYSLFEGQALNGTLVAVDTVSSDSLSYSAVQPSHGTVTVTTSATTKTAAFTYTPNPGYTGSDSFTFTAIDGNTTLASSAATVSLTVTPLPVSGVAPLANGGTLSVYEGQPVNGVFAAVDAATNPVSYAVAPQPAHGGVKSTASVNAYTYTPAAGYTGKDSFSYTATDTVTRLSSNAAAINITVVAPPLQTVAPLANDLNFSLYSGQAFTSVLSAVDVNGNPMTYAISTQPTHGTLSVTATSGAFVYTPSAGYTGGDSFAYTATDNVSNLASSAATASLTITAAPPPPPAPVHHGGPGIGAYGAGNLLLLLLLTAWRGLRRLLPALGAAALFWTASAGADDAQPANPPADPWYAGAQINVIKPDSSRDASTHGLRGWGLFFGKDIGDYALEFNGAYHADDPRSINGLANWKTYGLDGLWFFTHRASPTFSPFADAGLGFADQYHGDDSTLSKLYLALGIGFNSAPWQSVPVTLRTDLQLQHVLGSYNDLVLRFGLAFSFGGTQPAPAPTPLPDASPLDKYPMAWCTQEGGQPQQTDSGWVCYLPGGRTESRPNSAAPPPAATAAPPPVAVPTNPR